MRRRFVSLLFVAMICAVPAAIWAQELPPPTGETGPSGLPLPRFVSLGTNAANMRTGPGRRYPILWRYQRQGLPLLVIDEYGNWRRVRDSEGSEGWMHASLLSGRRTGVVSGRIRPLHARPDPAAPVILRAEPGVLVDLLDCRVDWCRVRLAGRKAWIRRGHFWGVFAGEKFD
ncbi:MAG: SH3 domain-containing protein [Rhodothalassiaceae bacterium]